MSKHTPTNPTQPYQPHLVHVADRHGDVLTGPSERARLCAATVSQEQRREAHSIIVAADRPAPTVREDLQAIKRRPWDAPMASPKTPAAVHPLEIWTPEAPPFGRIAATIFIAMAAFIAGLTLGRL